jgi:hypothetical protein
MRPAAAFLLAGLSLYASLSAAEGPQFDITDARGKKASGVTIEAGTPDIDGWFPLKFAKTKGEPIMVWPFDGAAKLPDGPEPIPVIAIQRGDEKALANRRVVASVAVPILLGLATPHEIEGKTGLDAAALTRAFPTLISASDSFQKGVGLMAANKFADAAGDLGRALKERQRQLTRVPSEIYPAALLYGFALEQENKFDEAAVAFLAALKVRPSDELARKFRQDALIKAGKPEAVAP